MTRIIRAIESKVTFVVFNMAYLLMVAFASRTRKLKKAFNTSGEVYLDTAVKVLIAVVLGALLLAGLYLLFNSTVLPSVTSKIKEIFNYNG